MRLEIETPDGELSEEQMALLKKMAGGDLDLEPEVEPPFGDLEELFEAEEREVLGLEFEWPLFPGSSVTIAHVTAMTEKRNELESEWRAKHEWELPKPLPPRVDEQLVRLSMFGTVIKRWSGIPLGGKPLPFGRETFLKLIATRHFREFFLPIARSAARFREKTQEAVEGN
jgi:hypothetical protein